MIKIIVFILLFFQAAPPAFCEEKIPGKTRVIRVTPKDIVLLALKNNRAIKTAHLDRETQKFDLKVSEAKFNPDLTIVAGPKHSTQQSDLSRSSVVGGSITPTVTMKIPTGGQFQYSWENTVEEETVGTNITTYDTLMTLSFTQPLLKGGGIDVNNASVNIAQIQEEINKSLLKSTLIDIITSALVAYRQLLQAHKQIEINKLSLQRAKDLLKINKTLISAGRMAKLDIIQTETDVAGRELDLVVAENDLDAARLALIDVLDVQRDTQIVPKEEFDVQPVQMEDEARLQDLALKNSPQYLQTLIQVDITELNLLLAKNNRLWDLSLLTNYGTSRKEGKLSTAINGLFDEYQWDVSLLLTIPLGLGDLTLRQPVVRANINLEKAKVNLKEARESIKIKVQDSIRSVKINMRRIDLAKKTRELSEKKLEVEKVKLNMGRTSNFQLVTFQNDLVTAQNNELNAKISYLNSLTSLDQVLGTTLDTWQIKLEY